MKKWFSRGKFTHWARFWDADVSGLGEAYYLIPAERWEKLRKLVAENNKNIGFMNEEEIKISLVYLLAAIEAIEGEV